MRPLKFKYKGDRQGRPYNDYENVDLPRIIVGATLAVALEVNMKVLVVDDDPIIRDMMTDILECEGCSISVARNGLEALKLLRSDEHYLVFLDMMMPLMSGKEVCEQLETEPHVRQQHVIVLMSALDKLEESTACKVEGIIPKPFVVEDVIRVLEPYMQ